MNTKQKKFSDLGNRMIERMRELGIDQAAVAEACKITQSAVSQILQRGSTKHLSKIAKVLRVNIDWLEDGTGPKEDIIYSQESLDKPYGMSGALYTGKAFKPEPGLIPVYGPAAAASDDSVMLTGEHIIGYEPCPPALSNVRGAFMMYIAGSSMEPRHYHGERVWVDPWTQPAIGQDCVVVLEEEGNAIVKRYMGREGTDFVLEQYNPPKKLKFKAKEIRAIYAVTR
ncbi:MAG TPA: S24 family peptidase [Alphaproteobacteria bacterium]|nr:S24 family peptidase [Alphaproteobacteria bacterium]